MRKQRKEFRSNLETLENRVYLSTMEVVPMRPPESTGTEDQIEIYSISAGATTDAIGGDGADVLRGGAGNEVEIGENGSDLLIVNNGDGSDFPEMSDELLSNGDDGTRDGQVPTETFSLNFEEITWTYSPEAVDELLSTGDDGTRDGQVPTESFSLNFEEITWTYSPEAVDELLSHPDDGTRGDPQHQDWIDVESWAS